MPLHNNRLYSKPAHSNRKRFGMNKKAVIFPGQGAQAVGMGREIAGAHDVARLIFERANDVLGFDLATLCFEGPAEKLEQTDVQQPAIFVTSVAIWEAYKAGLDGGGLFTHAGGLSLGEYTALYAAGCMNFDDALRLVRKRGELMQAAALASSSGMVSLIGADRETAGRLCDRAREDGVLVPANFNCPGQVVISGDQSACDRALSLAEDFGVRGVALSVAGAFHSPFMASAAKGLQPVLAEMNITSATMKVIANVDAQYHQDAASIRGSLCRQVTAPVLWQRCIERLMNDGVTSFVEIGPGRVLSGLMRKIDREMPIENISRLDSLSAAVG